MQITRIYFNTSSPNSGLSVVSSPDIVNEIVVAANMLSLLSFTSLISLFLFSSVELKMNNVIVPCDHHQIIDMRKNLY